MNLGTLKVYLPVQQFYQLKEKQTGFMWEKLDVKLFRKLVGPPRGI